jgi:hypothetical protein
MYDGAAENGFLRSIARKSLPYEFSTFQLLVTILLTTPLNE